MSIQYKINGPSQRAARQVEQDINRSIARSRRLTMIYNATSSAFESAMSLLEGHPIEASKYAFDAGLLAGQAVMSAVSMWISDRIFESASKASVQFGGRDEHDGNWFC